MARKLALVLLIAACAVVIGGVESLMDRSPGAPVEPDLEAADQRLGAVEAALRAYAVENESPLPRVRGWTEALGLGESETRDPFHLPEKPEPFGYWSDGTWYVLTSIGPDVRTAVAMAPQSLDPEATLEAARQFTLEHFEHRTPEELRALLGDAGSPEVTIIGDIRFRDAIYDPTNGLISQGDIVRWGRVGRPLLNEGLGDDSPAYDPTNGTTSVSILYRPSEGPAPDPNPR